MADMTTFPLNGRAAVPGTAQGLGPIGEGAPFSVCVTCRGPARRGYERCWSCRAVGLALGLGELPPVVPMCLLAPHSAAHEALVAYKAAPSQRARGSAREALSGMAGEWFSNHIRCLATRGGDVHLVPIPSSTGGRPSWHGRHPLEMVAEEALTYGGGLAGGHLVRVAPALVPGANPPRRLRPARDGFAVVGDLAGHDVVLLDDLYVSGARAMSAATAVVDAGAHLRAVVVLARFVRPDHNATNAAYWATFGRIPAGVVRCVRCSPPARTCHQVRARLRRHLVAAA